VSPPPIRTLTLGVPGRHPLAQSEIQRASALLYGASARLKSHGYSVQTVRISTRSAMEDLAGRSPDEIQSYSASLDANLGDEGLQFCSIGPLADGSDIASAELFARVLTDNEKLYGTVRISVGGRPSEAGICSAGRIIAVLGRSTPGGFGAFRFAALAEVDHGCPFFPAAYHRSESTTISIGIQGAASLAMSLHGGLSLNEIAALTTRTVFEFARPIVHIVQEFAVATGIDFGGVDLSPAPLGDESIVEAIERCDRGSFGSVGTLALVGSITRGIREVPLPTCGYNGLMFPVLEDVRLGERWAAGSVDVQRLLSYAAVCGTGLDAIPLSGDTGEDDLGAVLADVATLATRLQKPLSARLIPARGRTVGDNTDFDSPFVVNTRVGDLGR
jgi:uncharacterized protein (UPF0210 family)